MSIIFKHIFHFKINCGLWLIILHLFGEANAEPVVSQQQYSWRGCSLNSIQLEAFIYVHIHLVRIINVTWYKQLRTYLEVWKRSLKHKESWGSNFEQVEVGQEELEIMIGFSEHGDDGSKGFFRAHGVIPANLDCAEAIGLIPSQLPLID